MANRARQHHPGGVGGDRSATAGRWERPAPLEVAMHLVRELLRNVPVLLGIRAGCARQIRLRNDHSDVPPGQVDGRTAGDLDVHPVRQYLGPVHKVGRAFPRNDQVRGQGKTRPEDEDHRHRHGEASQGFPVSPASMRG